MADFLDEKRSEISARLKELKPLVDEYNRLEAAAFALEAVPDSSPEKAAPRRGSPYGRATGTRRRDAHGAKRGRPKGSGRKRAKGNK